MDKLLLKKIHSLIKDLDNYDYIVRVKYIIYLMCKILYECKIYGFEVLKSSFKYQENSLFYEFEFLNLNIPHVEEKLLNIIELNKEKINLENFRPGELYELLLTSKERKNLGQVYTPLAIIHKIINECFEVKEIDENTKLLDPSCGGGYFLLELFIKLKSSFKNKVDDKYIIENMLYGIDIDDFSIFLTKVGLVFLSNCTDVKFNIFNFDYLTTQFELGEFDCILGNPPYVGHKNTSTEYKKALYEIYSDVFYDKADISYCFFKKSHEILKTDGVVSFITSRYFMEALYANKIRAFIKNNFNIISLMDFNGTNVFKEAMVSAVIITLSNKGSNKSAFSYVKYNENSFEDKFIFNQDKLRDSGWVILKDEDEKLFNKIDLYSNTFIGDICTIKQGIITGFDKAFIVDEETIEKYHIENNLLKKWIKNSNISKSSIKYNNLYLLYTNIIDSEENYPNAIKYLSDYKVRLKNRRECVKGYRKWYELQWGRNLFDFENPKIIFPYKSKINNFYYDENKYFCSADVYLMNNFHSKASMDYLLQYLNSGIFEFFFKCQTKKVGNGIYEYYPNKLSVSKVFLPQEPSLKNISDLGKISIDIFLKKVFNISEGEENIISKYVNKG